MLARKKTAFFTSAVVALTLSLTGVSSAHGATGYATPEPVAATSAGLQAAADEDPTSILASRRRPTWNCCSLS